MAEGRALFEGLTDRPQHQSPSSEASHNSGEGSFDSNSRTDTSTPRRRLSRTRSAPNETQQPTSPTWVTTDKGDLRKAKGGRATPKRSSGPSPPHSAASQKPSPEVLEYRREKDTAGFLPRLTRILEGKESKTLRRRRGSTASSTEEQNTPRQHGGPENATLARRPIRQKHASLQRRAESLASLPNTSLISVLSGATQQSSASSGSNSTITQKSYDRAHIPKQNPTKVRKPRQLQKARMQVGSEVMEPSQSGVFQYMNKGLTSDNFTNGISPQNRPSSSTSSSPSSRDIDHNDGTSSIDEEDLGESPMTSPTSLRRQDTEESRANIGHTGQVSPQPRTVQCHDEQSDEEEEEDSGGEEEDEDEDEDEEEDDNASSADNQDDHHGHGQHLALERVVPPLRIPSATSSRHSDPHTRRMRAQEQELRNHVTLQNPQPHRDFQFAGGPSPNPPSPIPLYDSFSHTGASPANFYASAPQGPWPPPAPPPPQIDYYSAAPMPPAPYSPGNENTFAVAPRPPMAVPSTVVQPPPFHHPPAHPPHYQLYPTGPDLSRTTVVGYELLADKLSELPKAGDSALDEGTVVPMYRKFEQLNHRVLLHLQDEISELEEELRRLDECIAQSSPRDEAGFAHPASRRGEARYGSELHFRRTELLGRIYLKLGQYNQALSSYGSMIKNFDTAEGEEIQAYRAWMERRSPIDSAETRFLERQNDLLAVSRRGSAVNVGGVAPHHSAAVALPLILVLPLMAFAMVPGLLGRLFIIVVIGSAEVKIVTSTGELMEFMSAREWAFCASVYFGLMAVCAVLV